MPPPQGDGIWVSSLERLCRQEFDHGGDRSVTEQYIRFPVGVFPCYIIIHIVTKGKGR